MKGPNEKRFPLIAAPLLNDAKFQRLRRYKAHGNTSLYEHSIRVARLSRKIGRALRLRVNEKELIRGALLHDYYLYDWHQAPAFAGLHGYTHARRARQCAARDFSLTENEAAIIESHMWPLNLTKMPNSPEGWLVCVADKICSLQEILSR